MREPSDTTPMETLGRLCSAGYAVPEPCVMLVLAHPDDETVGASTLLPLLKGASFVYVTDGAPRDGADAAAAGCASPEAYSALRRGELFCALESIGVPTEQVEFLGHVDRETSSELVRLTRRIEIVILEHAPDLVLTHPYEGGHPDHDAAAFAVHTACRRIRSSGGPAPDLAEFTSYHRSGSGWKFGEFLPNGPSEVLTIRLSEGDRALKRRLIGCHGSQGRVLSQVPLETERFRRAPEYEFTSAPHPGPLLYEGFGWDIDGPRWRDAAHAALLDLEADFSTAVARDTRGE